jgi:hypothetical protein
VKTKIRAVKQLSKDLFLDWICISQNDFALKWGLIAHNSRIPIVYGMYGSQKHRYRSLLKLRK